MIKILNMFNCPIADTQKFELDGLAEVTNAAPDRDAAMEAISGYDIYIATLKFQVDREFIDKAEKLRAIFTPSTGTDHIDVKYCAEKGIPIFSMKDDRAFLDNVTATAELALALLLGTVRRLPWSFQSALKGNWARERYIGTQLSGKTCGILGYGRLGTMFASYAKALRMDVIACDLKPINEPGIRQVSFEELLLLADVLSIHIHLTEENRGLVDESAFSRMKNGVILINTSRGAVIDEDAFLSALQSGKVGAAGLDVINGEWNPDLVNHPLIAYARTHENLLISTHIGGVCYESERMAMENTFDKVCDFIQGLQL